MPGKTANPKFRRKYLVIAKVKQQFQIPSYQVYHYQGKMANPKFRHKELTAKVKRQSR